ncbi:MAG TPA: cytochrome c, partial [Myxococcaceae bacterium]|nr:cytochrome c [Myxococcaceae bacterium]
MMVARWMAVPALALAACGSRKPTYHEDVAPILAERCAGCHNREGVAPVPPLTTYEEAVRVRQQIKRTVQTRKMPPWGADNTSLCGTWEDALWLSDKQIATLVAWVDGDVAVGDPSRAEARPIPTPPALQKPGAVLDMGGEYTPGLGRASYRCFRLEPKVTGDALVTALRVVSSEPRAVAQVTLFALDSEAAQARAAALDAEDPGLGYACYGDARVEGARFLASWTWSNPVLRLPHGTGVRLGTGGVVMQVHYDVTAVGLAAPSRSRVEFELAPPNAVTEAAILALRPDRFELPGGLRYTEVVAEERVTQPLTLRAVSPRMHTLGKGLQIDLQRGASQRCVANFDHWNFYRQQLFRLERPVR